MTSTDVHNKIITLLQERKIAPTQLNISLILNAYNENFKSFEDANIEECIIEIFGTNGQIRRNGSKSVTFFNINPTGSFIKYNKTNKENIFLSNAIKISVLNTLFNPHQARNIILALKPLSLNPNTYIIKENDIGNEMYIIETGIFEIIKHDRVIETLSSSMIFGEVALLNNVKRTATVKCREGGKVWVLSMEDYIAIKSTYEMNVYKVFRDAMRDNIIFKSAFYKNVSEKKVFLVEGNVVDSRYYLVAVNDGQINDNGVVKKFKCGDVLSGGIVVDEIEGFYLPKENA